MPQSKPFSTACERNKAVICSYLKQWLNPGDKVLEIGSGTGQHGIFFSSQLPDITWQCTDQQRQLPGLKAWIDTARTDNLPPPFALDVNSYQWDNTQYQAVFSANTLHIMSWPVAKHFLTHVKQALTIPGKLILYGPFRYKNAYTSTSNAEFDQYLQQRDPESGIRDFEHINKILYENGFTLITDQAMPANNQLILWSIQKNKD